MVAGAGQIVVSMSSALWMPQVVSTNTARYGLIGVTLALVTWLIVLAAAVVAGAVVSAELGSLSGRRARSPVAASVPGRAAR